MRLYPDNEPAQRLRIQRFLMSAGFYSLTAVPIGLSTLAGITPAAVFGLFIALIVTVNAAFYALLRCGFNKRFRDPSLTVPQIVAAVAIFLYVQMYGGPIRGAYMVVLLIAFNFGAFKLHTRTLMALTLMTVAGYAALIPRIRMIEGDRFDSTVALLELLTLALSLLSLSVVIGSLSRLRYRLAASNAQLGKLLQKVTDLATHDELTGIYNRRYVLDMLEHETHRVARGGAPFCVCLLDLDHFKRINDSCGHASGDYVLRAFVHGVGAVQRDTDLFARYGGEEFLLFLPQTPLALAEACAERIRAATGRLQLRGMPVATSLTVSIGVAEHRSPESVGDLIERTDRALYRAKRAGRNRVEAALPEEDEP